MARRADRAAEGAGTPVGSGRVTRLSRANVVAWVAAVYHTRDAEQRVTEGRAAFQVSLDDGQTVLVRKRTGEYWAFPGGADRHKARTDRGLRRELGRPTGVVHDPSLDLTVQQLQAWLDTAGQQIGQIIDRGWAFLAIKGPIEYGGMTGRAVATLAVIKRTGEVWDLMQGWHAEAAYYATSENGFRQQIATVASTLQPIAWIPRL